MTDEQIKAVRAPIVSERNKLFPTNPNQTKLTILEGILNCALNDPDGRDEHVHRFFNHLKRCHA